MAALGINCAVGPELENPPRCTVAEWAAEADRVGMSVILKNPVAPLPSNCIGLLTKTDEPNGKGVTPAQVKLEADALRPFGLPIHLSLAGDKVTSANFDKPAEAQLYRDYLACCDFAWVNAYSMNRNSTRYPLTWTADAVAKLASLGTPAKIAAWIECSDQKLTPPPPPPGVARGPTPGEIGAEAGAAVACGAAMIGWFATSSRGAYGWPASFWPNTPEQDAAVRCTSVALGGDAGGDDLADVLDLLHRIDDRLLRGLRYN
jgi:hypothetical protein